MSSCLAFYIYVLEIQIYSADTLTARPSIPALQRISSPCENQEEVFETSTASHSQGGELSVMQGGMVGGKGGSDEGLGLGLSPGRFMNHCSLLRHSSWLLALASLILAYPPNQSIVAWPHPLPPAGNLSFLIPLPSANQLSSWLDLFRTSWVPHQALTWALVIGTQVLIFTQ
jgi:hypothetical protein